MSFFRKQTASALNPGQADARRERRNRILLCVLSGAMLGLSFPPSSFGVLACAGLIPLLIVLDGANRIWTGLKYSYLAMLVFHLIALNWTGGYAHGHDPYMMLAGALTMTVHPLFYWIPLWIYLFVRKHLGVTASLIALPFIWVAYEFTHSLTEWSFPWMTIGNSQSYDTARIQFISATGIFGLSFWILLLNVIGFVLYRMLTRKNASASRRGSLALFIVWLLVYVLPAVHGSIVLSGAPKEGTLGPGEHGITVGIVQSNIDPWEKWKASGYNAIALYLELTRNLLGQAAVKPDLVLWPETAIPYYILTPPNKPLLDDLRAQVENMNVPILSGLPHAVFYPDSTKAPPSAKRLSTTGERYDAFNAAALFEPGTGDVQWYGKMKMVPFAERVPYADAFYFLDFLRWNVGIGGWQIGPDSTIFEETRTGARFNTVICYESVYPDFVAAFVRKGAEFIAIITIDSWWDKMSGAYQHQQFAVFRAVENRRWLARCAVGGISCYIDPYGRVYDRTELFTGATLSRTIGRSTGLSFYTEHGDWLGEMCVLVATLFLVAGAGQLFMKRRRP